MTQCNDSDTRTIRCPNCKELFDGELPFWEAGEEECTHCEAIFYVDAEGEAPL
jgi:hypothetical protein